MNMVMVAMMMLTSREREKREICKLGQSLQENEPEVPAGTEYSFLINSHIMVKPSSFINDEYISSMKR